ncbi:MAG: hypothetical protein R6X29_02005 [Acidimicrobiia bacterium]
MSSASGDERRVDRSGIHIDREVADAAGIEEELDANVVGPYRFPDPRRRHIAGWIYLAGAGILALPAVVSLPGLWVGVVLLAAIGLVHLASAWPLGLEQEEALDRAAASVPFPVGHASAAVTFHGPRSRPHWQVLVYSADEPPSQRALVQIDAVTGEMPGDPYVEDVPQA